MVVDWEHRGFKVQISPDFDAIVDRLIEAERERDAARAALRTILNGEKRTDGFAPPPWVLHIARASLGQEGGSDGA